ncbi:hypothetical protein WA026_009701, partial [Henosepilachna vigintioctopunctata]
MSECARFNFEQKNVDYVATHQSKTKCHFYGRVSIIILSRIFEATTLNDEVLDSRRHDLKFCIQKIFLRMG